MNVLEAVLLIWLGIVVLAVGIDFIPEIWREMREAREAERKKVQEAEAMLRASILKRFEERLQPETNVVELKVVALPPKPVGGRHRLTAA